MAVAGGILADTARASVDIPTRFAGFISGVKGAPCRQLDSDMAVFADAQNRPPDGGYPLKYAKCYYD